MSFTVLMRNSVIKRARVCWNGRHLAPVWLVVVFVATIALVVAGPAPSLGQDSAEAVDMTPEGSGTLQVQPDTHTDPGWGEMTPERRAEAIEYSTTRHTLYFVRTFYGFALLIGFLATGLAARIRTWAERLARRRFIAWLLFFLAFSLILFVLDFPFTYYSGFALEHQYGHSNQTFGDWFGELVKGEAIGYIVGALIFWLLYVAIRHFGKRWWIWVGACTAPLAAFFIVIAPIWIAPMFNEFRPLSNEGLRDKILSLASEAGIEDSRVFEVDASKQSKKYNAYVTGLFGSKRIVLYDTILEDMTDDEILFVMGHEMGHYVMNHIWMGVAGVTGFVFLAAWLIHVLSSGLIRRYGNRWGFSQLGDMASFPLIVLMFALFGFLFQPASAAVSRHFERKSDEYGLALTHNREAAARAFEKLAAKNLSNPDPSPFIEFWLYDHPTIKDRVNYVLGNEGS